MNRGKKTLGWIFLGGGLCFLAVGVFFLWWRAPTKSRKVQQSGSPGVEQSSSQEVEKSSGQQSAVGKSEGQPTQYPTSNIEHPVSNISTPTPQLQTGNSKSLPPNSNLPKTSNSKEVKITPEKQAQEDFHRFRQTILSLNGPAIVRAFNEVGEILTEPVSGPGGREAEREQQALYELLKKEAARDPEERVRSASLRLLGVLKRKDLTPLFEDRLEKDSSSYVRYNAAWALGELRDKGALPLLERAFQNDTDPSVREVAQEAMKAIIPSSKTK